MNRWQSLTDREKRTLRYAGIGIAIYLTLFGGFEVCKYFQTKRSAYLELAQEARALRQQTLPYREKALVAKKLMEDFHIDPALLKKSSVVSDASAAIQHAAQTGGVQLGPIRETPARGSGATLATMQLESSGQVTAVLSFLAGLNTIGFPVVVEAVQFTSENGRPGMIKMNLTLSILNFEERKVNREAGHA